MHGGPYKMAADSGIIFKDTLFGRMSHKGKTSAACWQPVAFFNPSAVALGDYGK